MRTQKKYYRYSQATICPPPEDLPHPDEMDRIKGVKETLSSPTPVEDSNANHRLPSSVFPNLSPFTHEPVFTRPPSTQNSSRRSSKFSTHSTARGRLSQALPNDGGNAVFTHTPKVSDATTAQTVTSPPFPSPPQGQDKVAGPSGMYNGPEDDSLDYSLDVSFHFANDDSWSSAYEVPEAGRFGVPDPASRMGPQNFEPWIVAPMPDKKFRELDGALWDLILGFDD